MKHIEKCKPEEISNAIFDAANDSLLTNALAKEYTEVSGVRVSKVEPAETEIEELPSALSVFLKRVFKTPASLFQGKSMSQMFGGVKSAYDWLKERTKGSEFVPAKQLTKPLDAAHLEENLRVLDNRKISIGTLDDPSTYSSFQDGLSVMNMLFSSNNNITSIVDDNIGWMITDGALSILNRLCPSLTHVSLGCTELTGRCLTNGYSDDIPQTHAVNITIETLEFPNLTYVDMGGIISRIHKGYNNLTKLYVPKLKYCTASLIRHVGNGYWGYGFPNITRLDFPELIEIFRPDTNNGYGAFISAECPNLTEIYMPKLTSIKTFFTGGYCLVGLRKLYMPNLTHIDKDNSVYEGGLYNHYVGGVYDDAFRNLIHLEVGAINSELNLQYWHPIMALRSDTTSEDYVDLRESMSFANNLEQFLYNIQNYIADRITDRTGTSSLTLKLHSAVYVAIEQQEGQTILATLTNKNWTVASA